MTEKQDQSWLDLVAERTRTDAMRAKALCHAIQTLEKHSSGALVTFSTDFIGEDKGYIADAEIAITLKAMWPSIWEATLKSAVAELEEINQRYEPLRGAV